jgi:hypothetical protein
LDAQLWNFFFNSEGNGYDYKVMKRAKIVATSFLKIEDWEIKKWFYRIPPELYAIPLGEDEEEEVVAPEKKQRIGEFNWDKIGLEAVSRHLRQLESSKDVCRALNMSKIEQFDYFKDVLKERNQLKVEVASFKAAAAAAAGVTSESSTLPDPIPKKKTVRIRKRYPRIKIPKKVLDDFSYKMADYSIETILANFNTMATFVNCTLPQPSPGLIVRKSSLKKRKTAKFHLLHILFRAINEMYPRFTGGCRVGKKYLMNLRVVDGTEKGKINFEDIVIDIMQMICENFPRCQEELVGVIISDKKRKLKNELIAEEEEEEEEEESENRSDNESENESDNESDNENKE